MTKLLKKNCKLIVNECDVTKVLYVLQTNRSNSNVTIGTMDESGCGHWYVGFKASERTWNAIKSDLKDGNLKVSFPTKDSFGRIFYQEL